MKVNRGEKIMGKSITLTVVANMTSNYGEGLGNIGSVQKIYKNKRTYAIRSRESLKNAIMVQSGLYDDLQTEVDGATQKKASEEVNVANCRALEGGYMSTKGITYIRNSSFYLTDAVSCDNFVNETRFHNNLYLAQASAQAQGINLQTSAKVAGLMPYQYEYDKSLKVYSLTIDLDMIGKDENFDTEANQEEKVYRVNAILSAVENLSLVVRGNLDNAEPVFVVGGLSDRKTHYFENVVRVTNGELFLSVDLKDKIQQGYRVGLLQGMNLKNEEQVMSELEPTSVTKFFDDLREAVVAYFNE